MFDKMKELMELKRQADQLKKELEAATVEVNEVYGIKIVVNGAQGFKSIEIDAEKINAQNKSRLESEILRSINAAIKKSQQIAAQKMKNMPGLNIPGLT